MEKEYNGIIIPANELTNGEIKQRAEINRNKEALSDLMNVIKFREECLDEDNKFIKIWKTRDNFYCSLERFEKIKHVFEQQGYSVKYIHRFLFDDYYLLEWN